MPDLDDLFSGDDSEGWSPGPDERVAREYAKIGRVLARELERMGSSEDRLQGDRVSFCSEPRRIERIHDALRDQVGAALRKA